MYGRFEKTFVTLQSVTKGEIHKFPCIMKNRITTTLFLSILWLQLWALSPAEAVDRFVRTSGVNKGSLAVSIVDLGTHEVLGSHNSDRPLVPASIMKSVTTAALLNTSGIDYRYQTVVSTDGPVDMGILRGNLVVEGSCDPSLHTRNEPGSSDILEEIAESLRLAGIHHIEGGIIIDDSEFGGPSRPDSWVAEDRTQSYGTGSHALNFEDNSTGRKSVENPQRVFQGRLKSKLLKAGIPVDGKDVGEGHRERLMVHVSAPVDEIMRSCMMRSDNLFAESMLRTYGRLNGGDGSTADAARREYEMWDANGMPLDGVRIIDGSGLSRQNRVTAGFMTSVLEKMGGNPDYASFFPLAGQEGTLRSFLADTPLEGYIAMKTGSMRGIQCYAGYKLDDDYVPTHSVVIIMNDITGSREKAKKAAQDMLLTIFSQQTETTDEE